VEQRPFRLQLFSSPVNLFRVSHCTTTLWPGLISIARYGRDVAAVKVLVRPALSKARTRLENRDLPQLVFIMEPFERAMDLLRHNC
jgi:hypothetical protein